MNAIPSYLSLAIYTADGLLSEFYQSNPKLIRETLRLLCNPSLFTKPQLFLASEQYASGITSRSIDVIFIRSDALIQGFLPMNSPAGPVNVLESRATFLPGDMEMPPEDTNDKGETSRVIHVQVQTLGGWSSVLEVRAQIRGTAQDRGRTFANFFSVPVIPFHLETGGVGLINPANLTCTHAYPSHSDHPENALPMKLTGRSSFHSGIPANVYRFGS